MTVKLLLLKSGEDVIADVTEMGSGDKNDRRVVGYFLNKPCVVKLISNTPLSTDETNPKSETKSEMVVRMHPWAPLAKENEIPLSTDWVVTMITPVEKIQEMYEKDVLKDDREETSSASDSNKQSKVGLTD